MTEDTATFLLTLLNRQQVQVGAPDFDSAVAAIQTARDELLAVLSDPDQPAT